MEERINVHMSFMDSFQTEVQKEWVESMDQRAEQGGGIAEKQM